MDRTFSALEENGRRLTVDRREAGPFRPALLNPAERERQQARWFISLRWPAILVALLLSWFSCFYFPILPPEQFPKLLGVILILLVSNLGYVYLLHAWSENPHRLLWVQTFSDLVILTWLLHWSGGMENPIYYLYLFHVVISGILLPRRECFLVATVAAVLLVGMALGEWTGVLSHVPCHLTVSAAGGPVAGKGIFPAHDPFFILGRLISAVLVFYVLAYLVTVVADRLHRREVELVNYIDQHARLQKQLIQAERLASIGELAGKIAHEINNPMGIIRAKAELLLLDYADRPGMPHKVALDLRKIQEHARRIEKVTQGLLTYSHPSRGNRSPLQLQQVLTRAVDLLGHALSQPRFHLEMEFEPNLPPVLGNSEELQQVFVNLIANALDAMPQGGTLTLKIQESKSPEIRKSRSPEIESRKEVGVFVSDTGVGIPPSIRDRIFEPFFTTKAVGKGTGLGLSICEGIVRSHGGRIEVQSEPGRGSTFTVFFPCVLHPGGLNGEPLPRAEKSDADKNSRGG